MICSKAEVLTFVLLLGSPEIDLGFIFGIVVILFSVGIDVDVDGASDAFVELARVVSVVLILVILAGTEDVAGVLLGGSMMDTATCAGKVIGALTDL